MAEKDYAVPSTSGTFLQLKKDYHTDFNKASPKEFAKQLERDRAMKKFLFNESNYQNGLIIQGLIKEPKPDSIKEGFSMLRDVLPCFQGNKVKPTQVNILMKSAEYISSSKNRLTAHQEDLKDLKNQNKMIEEQTAGHGGKQITRLPAKSDCKVQITAYHRGLPQIICKPTDSRQTIKKDKGFITPMINRGGPPLPTVDTNHVPEGRTFGEMKIPVPKVGIVIGESGGRIIDLEERAAVKMVVVQNGPQQSSLVRPPKITEEPDKCEVCFDEISRPKILRSPWRIPSPIPQSQEPFFVCSEEQTNLSKEILLANHLVRWKAIKQKWNEAAKKKKKRHLECDAIVKAMSKRDQVQDDVISSEGTSFQMNYEL